ncbi:MAG: hypothetical protein J1F07_01665 [Muribaculaceae bacterium]|nr:hypothetical protein [Muribaculaceae bacterium]
MRKKVLGLVMAALAISTIGAFAQSQPQAKAQQEQTADCCKKDKKDHKKGHKKSGKKDRVSPFNGIQLTAEQQQKIDQLKADRKTRKEAAKAQDRQNYQDALAQILTPEQFQQYKDNCAKIAKGKRAKAHGNVKNHAKAEPIAKEMK